MVVGGSGLTRDDDGSARLRTTRSPFSLSPFLLIHGWTARHVTTLVFPPGCITPVLSTAGIMFGVQNQQQSVDLNQESMIGVHACSCFFLMRCRAGSWGGGRELCARDSSSSRRCNGSRMEEAVAPSGNRRVGGFVVPSVSRSVSCYPTSSPAAPHDRVLVTQSLTRDSLTEGDDPWNRYA